MQRLQAPHPGVRKGTKLPSCHAAAKWCCGIPPWMDLCPHMRAAFPRAKRGLRRTWLKNRTARRHRCGYTESATTCVEFLRRCIAEREGTQGSLKDHYRNIFLNQMKNGEMERYVEGWVEEGRYMLERVNWDQVVTCLLAFYSGCGGVGLTTRHVFRDRERDRERQVRDRKGERAGATCSYILSELSRIFEFYLMSLHCNRSYLP